VATPTCPKQQNLGLRGLVGRSKLMNPVEILIQTETWLNFVWRGELWEQVRRAGDGRTQPLVSAPGKPHLLLIGVSGGDSASP
jgi:hypothetical protein